ncbi:MAG: DinB family protein [Thermoanaerobaculia bacterium]
MASIRLETSVARLAGQFDEITRLVRFEPALLALRVERVSKWSIGLQVDHILKVLEVGQKVLDGAGDPLPRGMNLTGRIVLALGWFPRGVAKSPQRVLPAEQTPAELAERAAHLRRAYCDSRLPETVFADPKPVFPHPVFGGLSALQGLHFLGIHTHHHLKIVAEIRRANPGREAA